MTIFRFKVSVLTGMALAAPAMASSELPTTGQSEIITIVRQASEVAAQLGAIRWIERRRHDMGDMGRKLVSAGFRREEARPGCGAYTYAGQRDATGDDIIASFVVCPGQPPVALIVTLLPVEKNPKGPLPLIIPRTSNEDKK